MKLQDQINRAQKGNTAHVKQLRHVVKILFPKKNLQRNHSNRPCNLDAMLLAVCAFLWMANGDKNLTDSFSFVQPILFKIFTTLGGSYQGFTNQLARYHNRLMVVILPHFQKLTKITFEKSWYVAGYLLLAVDGSAVFNLPGRSRSKRLMHRKRKRRKPKHNTQKE